MRSLGTCTWVACTVDLFVASFQHKRSETSGLWTKRVGTFLRMGAGYKSQAPTLPEHHEQQIYMETQSFAKLEHGSKHVHIAIDSGSNKMLLAFPVMFTSPLLLANSAINKLCQSTSVLKWSHYRVAKDQVAYPQCQAGSKRTNASTIKDIAPMDGMVPLITTY